MVKKSDQIDSIQEVFNKAGGSMQLAIELGITQRSIIAWAYQGIPMKYWEALCELINVTPIELFVINKNIKASKTK